MQYRRGAFVSFASVILFVVTLASPGAAEQAGDTASSWLPAGLLEDESMTAEATAAPEAVTSIDADSGFAFSQHDIAAMVENYLAQREAIAASPPSCRCDPFPEMTARWHHGLEFASEDDEFKFHVGGRYQFDTAWFGADQAVQENINIPYGDGVDFRRARFSMNGTIYRVIDYATEIDFVNSFRAASQQPISITNPGFVENTTVALTDFWWQLREVPFFGTIRVGQQKEAIGFEHLVSSRFLPFMERSFNQDTFYGGNFNGFTPGIAAFRNYGADDQGVIQYGLYKPINNVFGFSTGTGDYSVVGRLTRLLWYQDQGRELLHLGVSGKQATAVSQAGVDGRVQLYRTRDAVRSGLSQDWPVPAGIALYGDDYQQVNAELAWVAGPWTLQGEYLVSGHQDARTDLANPSGGTVTYHGGYLQLMVFLTGEHDQYNKATGVFGRVLPRQSFGKRTQAGRARFSGGAWQMGGRYNYLDLNDEGFNGGVLHNQTYGLNWFLNPNMKAQFNYSATYRDVSQTNNFPDGSGWIHGFGTRIAMDF